MGGKLLDDKLSDCRSHFLCSSFSSFIPLMLLYYVINIPLHWAFARSHFHFLLAHFPAFFSLFFAFQTWQHKAVQCWCDQKLGQKTHSVAQQLLTLRLETLWNGNQKLERNMALLTSVLVYWLCREKLLLLCYPTVNSVLSWASHTSAVWVDRTVKHNMPSCHQHTDITDLSQSVYCSEWT